MSTIRIAEIFGPTLQGEGALIGTPTLFVRTGGCDYRCVWCDSPHAVDSEYRHTWRAIDDTEILAQCQRLQAAPFWITLSGGNPATQPLEGFIDLAQAQGYKLAMETQGSIAKPWFAKLDHLVLSPKPPSSKMPFDAKALARCLEFAPQDTVLKFVIFDAIDFAWAYALAQENNQLPCYIQPGNPVSNPDIKADTDALLHQLEWLSERAVEYHWHNVRILPQLHVLIWNNERGR